MSVAATHSQRVGGRERPGPTENQASWLVGFVVGSLSKRTREERVLT